MSLLLRLEEDKLGEQLPEIFERFEKAVEDAAPLFELEGRRLEEIARTVPQNQFRYEKRSQEMKHVVRWLENYRAKLESRYTKNYAQGQRAIPAREATVYINGEREIVEVNQLIIEASLLHQKLDAIAEGFKQMGFMVGHITRLRVAELQNVVL